VFIEVTGYKDAYKMRLAARGCESMLSLRTVPNGGLI